MKNKKVLNVSTTNARTSKNRRQFLKLSGMAVLGSGFLMACSDDDDIIDNPDMGGVFDLGSGDLGVLNYAYALEQLEADFYTKVLEGSYWAGANDIEKQLLQDLYNHEVNHRDFFSAAISAAVGSNTQLKLPELTFDYGNLNFGSRAEVLGTAKVLEDTGVAAYNGAGRLIQDPNYLVLAGKIVSVEARHASAIRTLINPGSKDFAGDDIVNPMNGLDRAADPSQIISEVSATGFITTPFTANNLP